MRSIDVIAKRRKPTAIESAIFSGNFTAAGEKLINFGYKDFGKYVLDMEDVLGHLNTIEENRLKRKLLKIYYDLCTGDKEEKEKQNSFTDFKNAMAFMQDRDSIEVEKDPVNNTAEEILLQPKNTLTCVSLNERFGFTKSDVIVIGKKKRIIDALRNYNYEIDSFYRDQIIIRNVDLLGVRTDVLFVFRKKGDPGYEKPPKKGSWQEVVRNKYKTKQYMDTSIASALARTKKMNHLRVVSKYYFRHKGHIYMLLLPPTMISLPFCEQKKGQIIPLINTWAILGVE